MLQQMLNLNGDVIRQPRKFVVKRAHDGDSMTRAIEKIRIAKGDMLRPGGYLSPDVRQHNILLYDSESAVVDRDHRAMPAEMLAAAAGFRIAYPLAYAPHLQRRVGCQRGELRTIGSDEPQPVERHGRRVQSVSHIREALLELAADYRTHALRPQIRFVHRRVQAVAADMSARPAVSNFLYQRNGQARGTMHGKTDGD